jgi:hypothetical protein
MPRCDDQPTASARCSGSAQACPSKHVHGVTTPLLTQQPFVQVRDAKAPVFPDVPPWDLAEASLLLEGLGEHAEQCCGFDRIQQRFEFNNREARLGSDLSRSSVM